MSKQFETNTPYGTFGRDDAEDAGWETEDGRQEAESRKQEPPRFDQTSARGGKALKQALRIKVTFFVFNSERILPAGGGDCFPEKHRDGVASLAMTRVAGISFTLRVLRGEDTS